MNRYLFTWEWSYRLQAELRRRQEWFLTKHGPDTVVSVSLTNHSIDEIMETLMSGGLFTTDKLIIVHDMPGSSSSPAGTAELEEKIMTQRENLYPDYFIIFVSPKPDKRKKSYKFFAEHCETKNFPPMDMRSIPKFLTEEFNARITNDQKLTRDHITYIVELVGKDGRKLANEIHKLTDALNALPEQTLTNDFIRSIVTRSQESSAFEISDELIKNIPSKDLEHKINIISESWEARQALQGGLLRSMKQLVTYALHIQKWGNSKELWMPPFVRGKYDKYSDTIKQHTNNYISIYTKLITFDYQIKTWQADYNSYRLFLKQLFSEEWMM